MIKSILLPLDSSPYTNAAIEMGCKIAKEHDAQLSALVVLDIEGIEKSIGPIPPGGLYYAEKLEAKHRKNAEKRVEELLEKFRAICKKEGIRHTELTNQGSPSERILDESIYYDLIITGLKTYFKFDTSHSEGESLSELLGDSITPVYGVPANLSIPDLEKEKVKVLIPFNASYPSARALQRFAQLMIPKITEARLIMSDKDEQVAEAALKHAKQYLELHGFEHVSTHWTREDIIQVCNDQSDWADAFVVGAHSKRGVFDFMVGNITNKLIEMDKKPVLIGQ